MNDRLALCNAIFRIPLTDYRRASYGLLIGSGSGTMMAVMDVCDRFRYAVDIDQCRHDRLHDWLLAVDRNELVDFIALAGWFSITEPKTIAAAMRHLKTPALVYSGAGIAREHFGNVPFVDTLAAFCMMTRHGS